MPTRRLQRILIATIVVAVSPLVGCGGSSTGIPTGLPVQDDFTDCSKGWPIRSDRFASLDCVEGSYRVQINDPRRPQNARIFFGEAPKSLKVESDATRYAGPPLPTIAGDRFLYYGVGCWASRRMGYVFIISRDGAWSIQKITNGASPPTSLARSNRTDAILRLPRTNRIRGVCVGGGSKATTLAFYVNDRKVAVATDPKGLDSFPGFGFFVNSTTSGTDVRFDNVVADEPTASELPGPG